MQKMHLLVCDTNLRFAVKILRENFYDIFNSKKV